MKTCCNADCSQGRTCWLRQRNSDCSDQGITMQPSWRDYTLVIDLAGAVMVVIAAGFASAYIPAVIGWVKGLL